MTTQPRNIGDRQQVELIKQMYNFLIDQKFHLEELAEKAEGRAANYLWDKCAALTEEIVALDAKRNHILNLKPIN
jgi:hypothetical protein